MTAATAGKSPRHGPGSLPDVAETGSNVSRSASLALRLTMVVAAAMLILVMAASMLRMAMLQYDAAAEIGSSQHIAWLALPRSLPDSGEPEVQIAEVLSRFSQARHVKVEFVSEKLAESVGPDRSETGRNGDASGWAGAFTRATLPEPLARQVTWRGETIGYFQVLPNPEDEAGERRRHIKVDLLLITSITIGLGLLVYWAVTRALNPLREVSGALTALGQGDMSVRLKPIGYAEFDELPGNFNRMAVALDDAMTSRRVLTDHLVVVEEQTRRQIAHALHDELSPYLVAIQPNLAVLEGAIAQDKALSKFKRPVTTISDHLRSTIQRMRQILETLHPPELASFGLIRAIREISEMQEAARPGKLSIALDLDDSLGGLSESLDTTLFRIVQESLTNALKHTDCTSIRVRLQRREKGKGCGISLSIWNDGVRQDSPQEGSGLGTLGIADRVGALGGELSIGPAADGTGGWEVAVYLPLGVK